MNAQLRRQTACLPSLTAIGSSVSFTVSLVGDYFELLGEGRAFARLDKSFAAGARRLVDFSVVFQACLERERWDGFRRVGKHFSIGDDAATFAVDVNVYSFRHHAEEVGSILLCSGIFLQYPTHNLGGETYYNPQILQIDGFQARPEEVMSEPDDTPASIVVSNPPAQGEPKPSAKSPDRVELILNSLSHKGILHEIRTDTNRIKSELMGQA